ncbi:MAG: glycoside hydrolase family 65 protein [Bacteroidota bacterium]
MKEYLKYDEWCIIEEGFEPEYNRISESIFSIGNGRMGQRAMFEEKYSGDTLQGSYVAGVYYPDKTKVGWWKNGYPEYFAKVLNATNWIGIDVEVDGVSLDLAKCEVDSFRRVLNMKEGYLQRSFEATMADGKKIAVQSTRFCSIVTDEIGAIKYTIKALNFDGKISVMPYLNGDVRNEDANWDEDGSFWLPVATKVKRKQAYVITETKKTAYQVATGMKFQIRKNGNEYIFKGHKVKTGLLAGTSVDINVQKGDTIDVYKYAAVLSSENYPKEELLEDCADLVKKAYKKGFNQLLQEQKIAWVKKWEASDVKIEGDVAAQQGIRFNIFHLNQTFTGVDARLNIGPKGFTGEKYGGSTYWDTEAYCLPFYLATTDQKVARNLLVYRYKHLKKAIENAQKLGFTDGAALYPMVTMNGEECHNEWEITFEEIHRNGAIAYAIYDYIRYTGDQDYLIQYGLEVLVGIARFWAQRVHFSKWRGQYVMHGVTGPNEYDNNVNNNWYTNYIAVWCMRYAGDAVQYVKENDAKKYKALAKKMQFSEKKELTNWLEICENMYFPEDKELGVFLQADGFLDKELRPVDSLRPEDQPLNQNWSWDRILRSCFIKQADVLQGIYFFEDHFDLKTIERNFNFYEPMTVHESSLSPCIHVILAAKIGNYDKAYEMYLRTSRLDLDDYNNDTEDGLHITSMAGTWLSVVQGFGGMRVRDGIPHFDPYLPENWKSLSFKIQFRGATIQVNVKPKKTILENLSTQKLTINLAGEAYKLGARKSIEVKREKGGKA